MKIDKGLEEVKNGVKMMKLIFGFVEIFDCVKGFGVFGIKECLVIDVVDKDGIVLIVL